MFILVVSVVYAVLIGVLLFSQQLADREVGAATEQDSVLRNDLSEEFAHRRAALAALLVPASPTAGTDSAVIRVAFEAKVDSIGWELARDLRLAMKWLDALSEEQAIGLIQHAVSRSRVSLIQAIVQAIDTAAAADSTPRQQVAAAIYRARAELGTVLSPAVMPAIRRLLVQQRKDVIVIVTVVGVLMVLALVGAFASRGGPARDPAAVTWMVILMLGGLLIALGVGVAEWLQTGVPTARYSHLALLRGTFLGSAVGGVTYVLLNVAAVWREMQTRQRRYYEEEIAIYEKKKAALKRILEADYEKRDVVNKAQAVWNKARKGWEGERQGQQKPNPAWFDARDRHAPSRDETIRLLRNSASEDPLLAMECAHADVSDRLHELQALRLADRPLFARDIDLDRRLLHVLMGMGLAAGVAAVAVGTGVDAFVPDDGNINPLAVLGTAFLIGMFPRLFERLLKTFVDRLIGEDRGAEGAAAPGPTGDGGPPTRNGDAERAKEQAEREQAAKERAEAESAARAQAEREKGAGQEVARDESLGPGTNREASG